MKLKKNSVHSKNNFTFANRFANLLLKQGKKNNAYRMFLDSLLKINASDSTTSLKSTESTQKLGKQKAKHLNSMSSTIRAHLQKHKKEQFLKVTLSKKKPKVSTKEKCLQILENVQPSLETRKVRRGATIYQVPAILSENRQRALTARWLISATTSMKKKGNKKIRKFSQGLGEEFSATLKKVSTSRQKREQMHLLAAQSRGNIRYRWW